MDFAMYDTVSSLKVRGKSGRVDLNHRPQRPERCALNQAAPRPVATSISAAQVVGNKSP